MKTTFAPLLILAAWLCATPLLAAQDQANAELYDAAAPADSAFVRVVNLSDAGIQASLSGKNQAQKIGAGQIGAYRFTPPGKARIGIGSQTLETELKANTASTIVFDGKQLQLIADKYVNEPKKAQVAFYNLSGNALDLKTLDGKHVIVENVAKMQTGSRMVNEIKIAFAAYAGEQQVERFDELFLKKGRSYSYFLIQEGSSLRSVSMANTIDPLD